MEDWDLQAIVRGFNNNNNNNNIEGFPSYTIHSPQPNINCFDAFSFSLQENNYDAFHEDFPNSFFQRTTALTELEQLIYRPFCPTVHSLISSPTMLTSCMSAPKQIQQKDDNQLNNAKASPPKSFKKRRNQQKREVKHVTEDGLGSDMWAWRKYGQKPIKGSPYPRSYYRCSSSKGCSARKQVERSPSNPEIFIVTYTAEHTHAHPTRRSSLAGSTRTKFPQSKTMSLDSTKHSNSPLTLSNVEYDDHDQHVQTTSIIKMEEVEISINETDLFTDHKILSHDELLPNSFKDLRRDLDQEMNEQTSEIALHNSGSFMDDEYFPDDFLSSWLS